jgi:hypothetical protein
MHADDCGEWSANDHSTSQLSFDNSNVDINLAETLNLLNFNSELINEPILSEEICACHPVARSSPTSVPFDNDTFAKSPIADTNNSVMMLDVKTNEILTLYPSETCAARSVDCLPSDVVNCVLGHTSTCQGFAWKAYTGPNINCECIFVDIRTLVDSYLSFQSSISPTDWCESQQIPTITATSCDLNGNGVRMTHRTQ